jgi:hypothetical protein
VRPASPRPVLDAQHGRARPVLDLDPRHASAGTVGQIAPLRHDPFEPERARGREDDRAVAVEMLGEANPVAPREELFKLAFALLERGRPQLLAVQLVHTIREQSERTSTSSENASPLIVVL